MKKAVVLGATGGMGFQLVNELTSRGIRTVAFSRNRKKMETLFGENELVKIIPGDVYVMEDLFGAVRDTDVIFHSVNIPYPEWGKSLTQIMKNVLEAAKRSHSKIVIVDNIYAYGKGNAQKITEDTPKIPHTKKGKIRLQNERLAVRAQQEGVLTLFAHFPDYYGPYAESTYLHLTLDALVQNKSGLFIGKLDVPREYIYTPDGAKALVSLALADSAYQQHWNIPGYGVITGQEIIHIARKITGSRKKIRSIGKGVLGVAGIFSPFMKEVREMMYLNEKPVILNGEKYEREIGPIPKTPYSIGIQKTIESLQTRDRVI